MASLLALASGAAQAQGGASEKPAEVTPRVFPQVLPGLQKPVPQANYELIVDAPAELLTPIKQRTLIGRWQFRPEYDPIQFEGLMARAKGEVEALMRGAGFFSGSVEVTGDAKSVRIDVNGGARTTVNMVELIISGPASKLSADDQKRFRELALERWSLPEGTFFNSEFWDQSKRRLLDAFQQKGYLQARIADSEARVDIENTTAGLRVEIDSGEMFSFGPLQLSGLERYSPEIVRDLSPFREGDRYDYERLVLFQQRLRESGYFATATVLPDLQAIETKPGNAEGPSSTADVPSSTADVPSSTADVPSGNADAKAVVHRVPILVELSEFKSKRIVTGVGYSSDQGVRGQLGFEHHNLFGLGWQLESALLIEQKRQRAFLNLRTPIGSEGHYWGVGARAERLVPSGEEQTLRSNLYIGRGRRLEQIEYFVSLQHQKERLDLTPGGVLNRDYRQALVVSYAWNMRRLDSRIDPRDGYTLSAQASFAAKGVVSETSFSRLYLRAMKFWPLSDDGPYKGSVLIGMMEYGKVFASSSNDIPSENLFRAGGSQSIRGYRYLELGPTAVGLTVGGRALALASLEYQRPVNSYMRWAAFIDAGNAAETFKGFKPVVGVGGGVRFKTPIGPVSADLAWGEAQRQFVFHFSVGYVF